MQFHDVEQGSQEWLELREQYLTASNAPAMMGQGYHSRDQAIKYALGIEENVITPHLRELFDLGHHHEDLARPKANTYFDLVLHPAVATREVDGLALLASFDGIPGSNDFIWEHKFTTKQFDEIPPLYYWQLEHQLLVADAQKAALTVTDRNSFTLRHYLYESVPERREQLISGWHKWLEDLDNYERTDLKWLALAKDYREIKAKIDRLSKDQKEVGAQLHEMAGKHSSRGGGLLVSVSQLHEKKQTPAAYIKEHNIQLPTTHLEQPQINYRITLEK